MGMMIDGTWHESGDLGTNSSGAFDRKPVTFRSWVTRLPVLGRTER